MELAGYEVITDPAMMEQIIHDRVHNQYRFAINATIPVNDRMQRHALQRAQKGGHTFGTNIKPVTHRPFCILRATPEASFFEEYINLPMHPTQDRVYDKYLLIYPTILTLLSLSIYLLYVY